MKIQAIAKETVNRVSISIAETVGLGRLGDKVLTFSVCHES